jgi:Mrp family chromosome partitioning ATPase
VLVSEDISMASVSFSDGGDNFFVMGAGQAHVVATERLASDALRRVLSELVAQYPKLVVIIDSGPILLTSESEAVISASDAVIFIVRAGVTPKSAVQDAVTRLGTARPVSLILNAWQSAGFGDQESYYGEYYGDSAGPGR